MRKLLVMMLSLALCISMSVTAFAADTSTDSEASETDYDVFVYVDDTGESLVVELQALNAVTDGVVTITYDTSVVSVEESDVVANLEAVDKYSVNAEEAGTLKISWISEEEATGTLFTLGFILSDGADIENAAFLLSGDVRNADGALMLLKNDAIEEAEKEALQSIYNTSLTLDEENYTEESWTALVEAQEAALAVLTNIESTQEEVNAALAVLNAAYLGLVPEQKTPEVDKKALQSLYTNALLLTESDYTSESWAVLDEAMEAVKTVLDNKEATQEEVDAAWQTLLEAYGALDRNSADPDSVNLDALQFIYDTSLKLEEEDYTSDSWTTLVEAQEAALEVLNNAGATQEEVDEAEDVLTAAYKGLVLKESSETNKSALQKLYDSCLALTESDYTSESWATFDEAMRAALTVLNNENATQDEVDAARNTLLEAYGVLDRNPADPDEDPDSVNLDALLLLYESSLKLTESNYTSESWAPLVTAQAGALAVLNDADPTQKEADDAFVVLNEALKGLVRVGDSDDSGDSGDSGNSGGSGGTGTTPTTVDKAPLQAAYDASVPLTESKYTAASWAPFVEARAAALVVLEDDNATQAQINEALAALLDAINGLVTYVDSATTGDSSALGLWIGIAVVALIAIVAVIVVYRKRMSKGGEK